ncbi:MAG: VIT domain-containing protein [Acidobacteriota bacterium]
MRMEIPSFLITAAVLAGIVTLYSPAPAAGQRTRRYQSETNAAPGALLSILPNGQVSGLCPLLHTDVKADISGPLARVTVEQQFQNPFDETIEAVYTFPLASDGAVDSMTMYIGDSIVRGKIKPKDEARAIYEAAKYAGHLAGLLDQERPNIFTQAVANIRPGENVKIVIRYVETVKYEDGNYAFSFPMVVGPRYNPRGTPNAASINPPVTPKGTRAGHDISVQVSLDAGVPINFLRSLTHDVEIQRPGASKAMVTLRNKAELPNKDFVLQYDVSGAKIANAVMTHRDARGGFFTMILQPPARVPADEITPKELIFVLDTSGSMNGFPIDKAKETMKLALEGLYPQDRFNLITFAGDTYVLFPRPVAATAENLAKAKEFLASRRGGGGTEMMKAIRAALEPSDEQDHVRVVCFMTDGYVGNDMEIIGEVKKHPNARVFSFGIGSSVNHFLLDQMAREGRGEVEYVGLEDDGSAAARRFHERVRTPVLTDLRLEWGGVAVSEVFPARLPDLFSAKPLIISGRYDSPGRGILRLRGKQAGRDFVRDIPVILPADQPAHPVLATLWARRKVDALMAKNWNGMQSGDPGPEIKEAITKLGVDFSLMTQFTSFVAVEDSIRTEGGAPRRVEVPVEMPSGVSYEGIFGKTRGEIAQRMSIPAAPNSMVDRMSANGPVAAPPRQASAAPGEFGGSSSARIDELDLRARLNSAAVREAEQKAGGFLADNRKIDSALLSSLSATSGRSKIRVKIWLSDTSADALAKLKDAGFAAISGLAGTFIIGECDSTHLSTIAKLSVVRYITMP